ncbi:MAG: hypothetical protein ACE5LB_13130, partial [Acidiferrobacterales bacterium]
QLQGEEKFRYFLRPVADELVRAVPLGKPTVYFVRDTLEQEAYEAEAVGRLNAGGRPALMDTVWITEAIRDPGVALAHELAHVLMDRGQHVDLPRNLMRADTAPENTELTDAQCEQIVTIGMRHRLLQPLRSASVKR